MRRRIPKGVPNREAIYSYNYAFGLYSYHDRGRMRRQSGAAEARGSAEGWQSRILLLLALLLVVIALLVSSLLLLLLLLLLNINII